MQEHAECWTESEPDRLARRGIGVDADHTCSVGQFGVFLQTLIVRRPETANEESTKVAPCFSSNFALVQTLMPLVNHESLYPSVFPCIVLVEKRPAS